MRFLTWCSGHLFFPALLAAGLAIVGQLIASRAPGLSLGLMGVAMAAAVLAIAAWTAPMLDDPWREPRRRRSRR